jgi:hypothetical protein
VSEARLSGASGHSFCPGAAARQGDPGALNQSLAYLLDMPTVQETAERLLSERLAELRGMAYTELLTFERSDSQFVENATCDQFEVQTQIFWDDKKTGDLRVMVAVWASPDRVRLISTPVVQDDFIRAADGSFVDE